MAVSAGYPASGMDEAILVEEQKDAGGPGPPPPPGMVS
jgi:hypothetical protein